MQSIILFFGSFLVLFIIYVIFFYKIGIKKNSIYKCVQLEFLKIRFNIEPKSLNIKKIGLVICIVDPLIISLTGTIVSMIKTNYIIVLLIGFVMLMALIYSFYEIIGRIIIKKRGKRK